MLKKLNECHNICKSLLTSLEHPADLRADYGPTYTNALDISLDLNKSLSMEDEAIHRPLPVTQTFNVTADNIRKLGETAYNCLKNEETFLAKLREHVEAKRKAKKVDGV